MTTCCKNHYGPESLTDSLSDAVDALISCSDTNLVAGLYPTGFTFDPPSDDNRWPDAYSVFATPTDCETPWNTAVFDLDPDPDALNSPCLRLLHDLAISSSGGGLGIGGEKGTRSGLGPFPFLAISDSAIGAVSGNSSFFGIYHPFDQNLDP